MAHHLIPSNATIKAIKPGDVRNRLADGAGLYLKLFVNGGSHGWRFDYSLNGRRNTLSPGTCPDTGLSLARKKAEEARKLVSAGIDPTNVRKEARGESALQRVTAQRAAAGLPPLDSFEAVAREWHTKNIPNWASCTAPRSPRSSARGSLLVSTFCLGWHQPLGWSASFKQRRVIISPRLFYLSEKRAIFRT
jgi:hypothetical protein